MKKLIILLIFCVLSINVSAEKGIGIIWDTESELVEEGQVYCIEYGLYNPFNEDVKVSLSPSQELSEVLEETNIESKNIQAGTFHNDAVPVNTCFQVKNIYKENCIIKGFMCEKKCDSSNLVYNGKVIANEETISSNQETGSSTNLGISVPLKLTVSCSPKERDYIPIFIIIFGSAWLIIGFFLHKKIRK